MRTRLASALLLLAACGGPLRSAHLSEPAVTDDGTVYWLEMRAREHGPNEVRVIMGPRGARPVCVRARPEDVAAR
ncbi:MAG TPA: hypothetical protein VIL20_25535 [Sandaracinaceae bacterium]